MNGYCRLKIPIKLVNGIQTLTDFKTDRRISAGFKTGQLTGNATLYVQVALGVWQTFQIVDTNPNAVCACPLSRLAPYFTCYLRADFEFVATITVMCEGNRDERKMRCVAA